MRDIDHLKRMAAGHGQAIGTYASALLDSPLPWTKMRQVYALLGLVKRWGPERVEAACGRALEAEAISVALIGRMIERATESSTGAMPPPKTHDSAGANPPRFARDPAATSPPPPPPGVWHDRPAPAVTAELKVLLRTLKLGRCTDTLPERMARPRHRCGAGDMGVLLRPNSSNRVAPLSLEAP